MNLTKSFITVFAFFISSFCIAQKNYDNFLKYPVKNIPKTHILVDASKDSVIQYFKELNGDELTPISANTFQLFDDSQAFITKEMHDREVKRGMSPSDMLFTHEASLASLWELNFHAVNESKTKVEFELKTVLVDSTVRLYNGTKFMNQDELWKELYQNQKLVSRGIIEDVHEINLRSLMLPPLITVEFSKEKGFDNKRYSYTNFIPSKKITPEILLTKEAPVRGESVSKKSILIYDRNQSKLSLIDPEAGKVIWIKSIENNDHQNLNTFTVFENTVYVAASSGYIYALSAKTGEQYWRCSPVAGVKVKNKNDFFGQSLPISGDYIYANYSGVVFKVNRFNGKVEWSQTIGGYGHYNYSFDKENLYKTGILECFVINKESGEVVKIINNTEQNTFYAPHFLDQEKNVIYLSDGSLYAFDLSSDKILWKHRNQADLLLVEKDTLYANTDELNLIAINRNTGAVLWENRVVESQSGTSKGIDEIYDLKDEIMMDVKIENYTTKETSRQLVFINKRNGELNLMNTFGEKILSNPVVSDENIFLLTPEKIITINLKTKDVSEKQAQLSVLNFPGIKHAYDHYAEMVIPDLK